MAFDAEKAVWIDTGAVCSESGTPNCGGKLGVDPKNRKQIQCSTSGCAAQLSQIVVPSAVENPAN